MSLGWRDAAVPAVLLVVGAAELGTLRTTGWLPSIGLEALAALALVFRRTHPFPAVPVMAVPLMLIPLTGTQMDDAATPIFFYVLGVYSLGRYLSLRGGIVALLLTLALVAADFGFDPSDNDWTDLVFVLSLAIPPYVFGRISRRLAEQSDLLAHQAEQLRDQAVRAERDRIARELHDVVAHSVSAMVVQTAAAQDLVRTDPDRAGELLASVAETGRRALAETGRLLHLVRDDADELGLSPAPGLADVPALVEEFREGGLTVDATLDLPERPVPGGIDVSAYRVVQEALTNALKYAHGSRTRVHVHHGEGETTVEISTDGPGSGGVSPGGSGRGLAGLRERVTVLGGDFSAGAQTGGGFLVRARIPAGDPS